MLYRDGSFAEAEKQFKAVLERNSDDREAMVMFARCQQQHPPRRPPCRKPPQQLSVSKDNFDLTALSVESDVADGQALILGEFGTFLQAPYIIGEPLLWLRLLGCLIRAAFVLTMKTISSATRAREFSLLPTVWAGLMLANCVPFERRDALRIPCPDPSGCGLTALEQGFSRRTPLYAGILGEP